MSDVPPPHRRRALPLIPERRPGPGRSAWDFALMVVSASVGTAMILLAAARLVQAFH